MGGSGRFDVFTDLVLFDTSGASGGHIFRCTTKDMGERHAASSQAPYHLWQLCAASAFISLLLLPPPNPLALGFGGDP